MPAYLVADVEWQDDEQLAGTARATPSSSRRYGGRILDRVQDVEVVEGKWKPRLLVIFEFPSREAFHSGTTRPSMLPSSHDVRHMRIRMWWWSTNGTDLTAKIGQGCRRGDLNPRPQDPPGTPSASRYESRALPG